MGASQSRSDSPSDEKVIYNEVPIHLSGELVSKLAEQADAPDVSPGRQSFLDSSVRQRILQDVAKLKAEEVEVQRQIELALERENLDRERSMAGDASAAPEGESTVGDVKSSVTLLGDLEEIRQKVDRYKIRQDLVDHPDLKAKSGAVIQCYKRVFISLHRLKRSDIIRV
ncbi:hypothetical protein K488DRAFT_56441 [Vararia minispora EC-137]|uniref:Uncharacterized protein n=1 Tax=Vararia minispora EC-137 TaxID=1314806 RepID=A0ACB8QC41_9AGAM|nr:hypothetical protein K488DRAFT_56441 [Vararia minispora EC-137]